VKVADFRQIALSLPEAVEGSHFGHADFRVGGKIFATLGLAKEGYGVLLLSPEEQAGMVEDAPDIFSPVPGGWGRQGSTRVRLANVAPDILEAALRTAWRRRAPKRLVQATVIPEGGSAHDRAARRPSKRRPTSRNRPAKTVT
jgi:hypothetical protein